MRGDRGATLALAVVAVLAGGCGSTAPPTLGGNPSAYLLTLDQLPSPDFTVYLAAAPIGAGWLDPGSSTAVERDGLVEAAEVEYYRQVAFATSNGPITLTAAAARFTDSAGAAAAISHLDTALDARSGASPVSTGSLAGGHAITVEGTLDGVQALEIVVLWRVENLVNSLDAEGRAGGLALDQLLPLATTQSANELRR
jgi:hypothetical protein